MCQILQALGVVPVSLTVSLAIGYFAVPALAGLLPWYLQFDWRADVAVRDTPSASTKTLLASLADGNANQPGLVPLTLNSEDRDLLVEVAMNAPSSRDDLGAEKPGRVLVDYGSAKVLPDGLIVPARQVALCYLRDVDGRWRLHQVSPHGEECRG